jgi:hypothetical protein
MAGLSDVTAAELDAEFTPRIGQKPEIRPNLGNIPTSHFQLQLASGWVASLVQGSKSDDE